MQLTFIFITLLLTQFALSAPLCYSDCAPPNCTTYGPGQCTFCDDGMYLDTSSNCQGIPIFVQVLQHVDYTWTAGTPNYLQYIGDAGSSHTSSNAFGWIVQDFPLPQAVNNIIHFDFANLPQNYYLQMRVSGYLDIGQIGCLWNFINVNWFFSNQFFTIIEASFTLVVNFTGIADVASVQIQNLYSSNAGACGNLYISDLTFVAFLCNTTCATCSSYNFCTSCGIVGGMQLYLEQFLGTCSITCTMSYYSNAPNYICDGCDISCATCSSTPNCITCNSLLGYVFAYMSTNTCVNLCPPGQYKNIVMNSCLPCSVNCLTCKNTASFCTSCPFSASAGGQLFLNSVTATCLINCPALTFINITANTCDKCNSFCLVCFGSLSSQCSRCGNLTTAGVTTIYYLYLGSTTCGPTCPTGQYIDINIPNYCQQCSSLCIYCDSSPHNCTNSVCPLGYFYYAFSCMSTCIAGTYPDSFLGQCFTCAGGCALCTNSSLTACSSCQKDPVTQVNYYLAIGTTKCVTKCPNGQFNTSAFICVACDPTCATCNAVSTNCTTCTYLSLVVPLFFNNYTCSNSCLPGTFGNLANPANHTCTLCHPSCTLCLSSNIDCLACTNVTTTTAGITTTTIYYKYNTTNVCNTTCPIGQFIQPTIPNSCSACDISCTICINLTNCQGCTVGYYLHLPSALCYSLCPAGFYNDPTNYTTLTTLMTTQCASCNTICKTCNGPLSSNCLSCHNITTAGVTKIYFKNATANQCDTNCSIGYFGDALTNLCSICQNGCISCKINSSNCDSCTTYLGISYFKPLNSTGCFSICPGGTFGNLTDMKCWPCLYYIYLGDCIKQCPTGYVGTINTTAICVPCNSTNISCDTTPSFVIQSKVTEDGHQFQHSVAPKNGIYHNLTQSSIADGLMVYTVTNGRRRLLTSTPLSILGITFSADRTRILINTVYYPIDIATGSIIIDFRAGALLAANGIPYNLVSGTFSLNDPTFIKSYYLAFQKDKTPQIQGITVVCVSFVFFLLSLFFNNHKITNQFLSLIQIIQIIGLSKLRKLPIVFTLFDSLKGYDYYSCIFLPNAFTTIYADTYTQQSLQSVQFTYGTHHFLLNFGGALQFFLFLQLIIVACFIYFWNSSRLTVVKQLQEYLLVLWSTIFIFGSVLDLLALKNNNISDMNVLFLVGLVFSFAILVSYGIYFSFWVKQNLQVQLYKVNNVFRLIPIFLLSYSLNAAVIFFNLSQIFFILADMITYRSYKINKFIYLLERIIIIMTINVTLLVTQSPSFLLVVGPCIAILFIIKIGYFMNAVYKHFQDSEIQKIQLQISGSVNMSIAETVKQSKILDYSLSKNQKLNQSQNFIINQTGFQHKVPVQSQVFSTYEPDLPIEEVRRTRRREARKKKQSQETTPNQIQQMEEQQPRKSKRKIDKNRKTSPIKVEQTNEQAKEWENIQIIQIQAHSDIDPQLSNKEQQDNKYITGSENDKSLIIWQPQSANQMDAMQQNIEQFN